MLVKVDYLVIGSGLAGLTYALSLAQHGSVALLTKKTRSDANSSWAQGGIAGVLADNDSFEMHKQDTLTAGAGLCHEDAVDILVHEGPERIRELIALGAQFNMETDAQGQEVLSLGREGGHSRNRIVHTADYTGWECERTLLEAVKAHPEIQVYEHNFVTDLVVRTVGNKSEAEEATGQIEAGRPEGTADESGTKVCIGANTLHGETSEQTIFQARATLLATGGCGQIYEHTTNPLVATGDGVAMAWRAGVPVANMEFIQFHPTTLYHPSARAFLITEALRGEGGILQHADGEQFMARYHPLRELAPRDIVARAIVSEMKRRDVSCVYLDVSHLDPDFLKAHFPTVYDRCLSVGIDITREPIPIVPAQHYQCGGVVTDLQGATAISRLYAAGEVACTGIHGANRLASNSLLEAMVFGYRAAHRTLERDHDFLPVRTDETTTMLRNPQQSEPTRPLPLLQVSAIRERVQQVMQRRVGIVRSTADLLAAQEQVQACLEELRGGLPTTVEGWEAINIAQVGLIIIESALHRHESRGLHFTTDYPETLESEKHDTVLTREGFDLAAAPTRGILLTV